MPAFLRAILRIGLGVLGVFWCLGGLIGAVAAGIDRAWGVALGAALGAVIGYGLAYAAFVRMPWEEPISFGERAG